MTNREFLKVAILDALGGTNKGMTWPECAKAIWACEEAELRKRGDLFYTWQYDMRWAMQVLRDEGKVVNFSRGMWALAR